MTRAWVERAALFFDEVQRLPVYDEEDRREGAAAFMRFVQRVDEGPVDDDARALAAAVIARGAQWLSQQAELVPVPTERWDLAQVEAVIVLFNQRTVGEPSPQQAEEIVEELRTFEVVVRAGAVEGEDAQQLALAFIDYALRWMERHPRVLQRYQSRGA